MRQPPLQGPPQGPPPSVPSPYHPPPAPPQKNWWSRRRTRTKWFLSGLVVLCLLVIVAGLTGPNTAERDATATVEQTTKVANTGATDTAKQTTRDAAGTATAALMPTRTATPMAGTMTAITVASTNATASPLVPASTPIPPTEMPIPVPATGTTTNVPLTPAVIPTIAVTATSAPTATTEPTQAPKPTNTPKPQPTATMVPTAKPAQTQQQTEAGWVKQDGNTWLSLNADGKAAYAKALLDTNEVPVSLSAFALTVPGVVAAMDLYEKHADARLRGLSLSTVFIVAMEDGNENCPHPYTNDTPPGLPCYPGAK